MLLFARKNERPDRGAENRPLNGLWTSMPFFPKPEIGPDDTAVVFYTSGTTGKPKGVMLSAGNIRAIAKFGRNRWK